MTQRFFPISGEFRDVPEAAPAPEPEFTWWEAFKGGFKRQSTVNAAYEAFEEQVDWDYDPMYFAFDDEENQGYPPDVVIDARSADHAAYLRSQVDADREDLRAANESWAGVMGEVVGAIGPEAFAGGALLRGTQIGYKGFAATEGALVGLSEALLHTQQHNRTIQESLLNTGVTYGASLALGKAASLYGRLPPPETDVPLDTTVPPPVSTAGAMEVPETFTTQDLQMTGGKLAETISIGPLAQVLVDQVSPDASRIALQLADSAFAIKAGQQGKTVGTTVESASKRWQGVLESSLDQTQPLVKESGLSQDDFWSEVGNAMSAGDKHLNPQVQQAAQTLRGVTESLERDLKEFDLLPKTKAEMLEPMQQEAGRDIGPDVAKYEDDLARYEEAIGPEPTIQIDGVPQELIETWQTAPKTSKVTEWTKDRVKAEITSRATNPSAVARQLDEYAENVKARDRRLEDLPEPKLEIEGVSPKTLARYKSSPTSIPRYAESYFPRIYRADAIMENWESLKSTLAESFARAGVPDEEAPQAAIDTMINMMGGSSVARTQVGRGRPSALKQRMVKLADETLAPYMERRADIVLRNHMRGTAPYLEMTRRFGDFDLTESLLKVDDTYKAAIDRAATDAEKKVLHKKWKETTDNLQLLRNRALHIVDGAADRTKAGQAVRFISTWNAATQLGGIVFSSSPDVARPLMAYGLRAFGGGAFKTIGTLFRSKEFRAASRQQVKRYGVAMERALNQRALDLMDTNLAPGERATRRLGAAWAKWSGFNHYTDFMEHLSAQIASDWLMRQARTAAKGGKIKRSAIERITRMGLDENALRAINDEMQAGSPRGDLWMPNTAEWADQNMARTFDEAITSEVHRNIVRIGIGDKPKFMDQTAYQLLFQYWSFAMASTNRMLVAGIQQRDAQLLSGLLAAVGAGMLVRGFKAELRGDDTGEWTGEKWILEGIDGMGIAGIYSGVLRMAQYAMNQESSRYLNRSFESLFPIAGPTASTLGNIGRAGYAAATGEGEDAYKYGARALPFINNTWHVRQALERSGAFE